MNDIQTFINFDQNIKNLEYEGYILGDTSYSYKKQIYGEFKIYSDNEIYKIKNILNLNGYTKNEFEFTEYIYKNIHKQLYQSKKEFKFFNQEGYFIDKNILLIKFIINNIEPTQFPNLYAYETINDLNIQEFSKNNFIIQIINNKDNITNYWIKIIIRKQLNVNFIKEISQLELL
jgi:hypothetical protein